MIETWTQLDARSLAFFRILFGAYLLYDIFTRFVRLGPYDRAWYTSIPAEESFQAPDDTPHRSAFHRIWFFRGSEALQMVLFGSTAVLAFLFTLGFGQKTRFTGANPKVLLFMAVTSYQCRNMPAHDGSDTFTRHLLLWSCFLPLAEAWSVDAALSPVQQSPNRTVSGLPCLAIKLQLLLMYWGTMAHRSVDIGGFEQIAASDWFQGTAVHYALSGSFAVRDNWATKFLQRNYAVTYAATIATSAVEFLLPLLCLVLNDISVIPGVLLVQFHAGLLLTLRLPNWQLVAMLAEVIWIPASLWDRTCNRAASSPEKDDYKKTDGDDCQSSRTHAPAQRSAAFSRIPLMFFLTLMVYDFISNRGWIPKFDNGDIGEGLRLSQYWVMFAAVSHTAHHGFLTGTVTDANNRTQRIDLFQFVQSPGQRPLPLQEPIDGPIISNASSRYPSQRWERAVHEFGADLYTGLGTKTRQRIQHFAKALCRLVQRDLDRDRATRIYQLQSVEWRVRHYLINPPPTSSKPRFQKPPANSESVEVVVCGA